MNSNTDFEYMCKNCRDDNLKDIKMNLISIHNKIGNILESFDEYILSSQFYTHKEPNLSLSLDERIREYDPYYTREKDSENYGDDMDEVPDTEEWKNMSDESKLEFLDRELDDYWMTNKISKLPKYLE